MQNRWTYSNAEHHDTSITAHLHKFSHFGAFPYQHVSFWCQMTYWDQNCVFNSFSIAVSFSRFGINRPRRTIISHVRTFASSFGTIKRGLDGEAPLAVTLWSTTIKISKALEFWFQFNRFNLLPFYREQTLSPRHILFIPINIM